MDLEGVWCRESYRCIHAFSQLAFEGSTALSAVALRGPAVQHRRHHGHAWVLLILIRSAHAQVVDGVQAERVEPGRDVALGSHFETLFLDKTGGARIVEEGIATSRVESWTGEWTSRQNPGKFWLRGGE